jgi:hypothetical protein
LIRTRLLMNGVWRVAYCMSIHIRMLYIVAVLSNAGSSVRPGQGCLLTKLPSAQGKRRSGVGMSRAGVIVGLIMGPEDQTGLPVMHSQSDKIRSLPHLIFSDRGKGYTPILP